MSQKQQHAAVLARSLARMRRLVCVHVLPMMLCRAQFHSFSRHHVGPHPEAVLDTVPAAHVGIVNVDQCECVIALVVGRLKAYPERVKELQMKTSTATCAGEIRLPRRMYAALSAAKYAHRLTRASVSYGSTSSMTAYLFACHRSCNCHAFMQAYQFGTVVSLPLGVGHFVRKRNSKLKRLPVCILDACSVPHRVAQNRNQGCPVRRVLFG